MKNVLEYLEASADRFPDKTGFTDTDRTATFSEVMGNSKKIGSALSKALSNTESGASCKPVAVIIDRNIKCIEAMFGAVYAGGFYVVIDVHSPASRISTILNTLDPATVITDSSCIDLAHKVWDKGNITTYENALKTEIDRDFLSSVRRNMVDTDPVYVLFTSGSTGMPKGAVLSHKSVLSYTDWVSKEFGFSEHTSFGAQTPLYFSMSVTDLYSTIKCGGTYNMIPKACFTFPVKLIEFINNRKVNTLYWVPSALSIISNWNVFEYEKPQQLKKVLFAGEVMPVKHLNYWQSHLPNCLYANLFGPTETTDICTFYVVDRKFHDEESLPIGKACDNCNAFLIKENGEPAAPGEEGELVIRGSFLADGYYNDPEKTAQVFIQNPLNSAYPEKVYKTGDLVKLNEKGEFIYITRKDFQVKRMGYRIELGEIEAAALSIKGVKCTAALYDDSSDRIIIIYEGNVKDSSDILQAVKNKVPSYMHPDEAVRINSMPYNPNGKIDRIQLRNEYIN